MIASSSQRNSCALILAGALLAVSLFFSGCATPSTSADMAVAPTMRVQTHAATVSVTVTGGHATSSVGASQISNEDFAQAVQQSIESSGLFAKILPAGAADYNLAVFIVRLQQPMFGFSMTVTMEASWSLTRKSDHAVVWQKDLATTYTAKASDAFAGVTRLRLANEGAARANIAQAIDAMSRLTLP